VVLEFLPQHTSGPSPQKLAEVLVTLRKELEEANNVYRGAQLTVDRLNSVVCSDRCMYFRLLPPDYHAEAIAEERRMTELYPFLGLKFPPVSKEEREKVREAETPSASAQMVAFDAHDGLCVLFLLQHAALVVRAINDTTSFSSLIIGTFDQRQRPRTVVSPRGTATTVFSSPVPSVEEPIPPRAVAEYPLSREIVEQSIRCGVHPCPGLSAVPPMASSLMPRTHSDTDLHQHLSTSTLDLSDALLRVPLNEHTTVLRSLGIRSSQSYNVVVNGELDAVLAFYGSAHSIVRKALMVRCAARSSPSRIR
jgi:hypothetical protein